MSHTHGIDRYTCEEMFRRLDDFVDRELSPLEMQRAREHLETCAACASEYEFAASMLGELKGKLRRVDVPPELLDRIALQLAQARAEQGGATS
jgi:anti-sigma factor (TIGR02949 family)